MGNKSNLLLTTIVESRHHAITPFLVSDGGGGGLERGGEGQVEKVYSFSTLKMVKKVLKAASF